MVKLFATGNNSCFEYILIVGSILFSIVLNTL